MRLKLRKDTFVVFHFVSCFRLPRPIEFGLPVTFIKNLFTQFDSASFNVLSVNPVILPEVETNNVAWMPICLLLSSLCIPVVSQPCHGLVPFLDAA